MQKGEIELRQDKPAEKSDFSPCVCMATTCHFNGSKFNGVFGYCHLKEVYLDGNGRCTHFIKQEEASKVFRK